MDHRIFDQLQTEELAELLAPYAPDAHADRILAQAEQKAKTCRIIPAPEITAEPEPAPRRRMGLLPALVSLAACAVLVCGLAGIWKIAGMPSLPEDRPPAADSAAEVQEPPFGDLSGMMLSITEVEDGREQFLCLDQSETSALSRILRSCTWGEVYDLTTSEGRIRKLNSHYIRFNADNPENRGRTFNNLYLELTTGAITWQKGGTWQQVMAEPGLLERIVNLLHYGDVTETPEEDPNSLLLTRLEDAVIFCGDAGTRCLLPSPEAQEELAAQLSALTPVHQAGIPGGQHLRMFISVQKPGSDGRISSVVTFYEGGTVTQEFPDRGLTYSFRCEAAFSGVRSLLGDSCAEVQLPYDTEDRTQFADILHYLFGQRVPFDGLDQKHSCGVLCTGPAFAPALLELSEEQYTALLSLLNTLPWEPLDPAAARPDGEAKLLYVMAQQASVRWQYYTLHFYPDGQVEYVLSSTVHKWYRTSPAAWSFISQATRLDDLPEHLIPNDYEDPEGNGMTCWEALDDAAEQVDLSLYLAEFEKIGRGPLVNATYFSRILNRRNTMPGEYARLVRQISNMTVEQFLKYYRFEYAEKSPVFVIEATDVAAVTHIPAPGAEEVPVELAETQPLLRAVCADIGKSELLMTPQCDPEEVVILYLDSKFGDGQQIVLYPAERLICWQLTSYMAFCYDMTEETAQLILSAVQDAS